MSRYFRRPDAMWREEEAAKTLAMKGSETGEDTSNIGTSIILSSGKMHSFNLLGTEVWKLCDGRTLGEIVSELEDDFEVDREVLARDVRSFLEDLKGLGLVYEE